MKHWIKLYNHNIVGSGVKPPHFSILPHPFDKGTLLTENSQPPTFLQFVSHLFIYFGYIYWKQILSISTASAMGELHHK